MIVHVFVDLEGKGVCSLWVQVPGGDSDGGGAWLPPTHRPPTEQGPARRASGCPAREWSNPGEFATTKPR